MERRSFLRTTVTTAAALWLVAFVEGLVAGDHRAQRPRRTVAVPARVSRRPRAARPSSILPSPVG
jgi:hypothetical protein